MGLGLALGLGLGSPRPLQSLGQVRGVEQSTPAHSRSHEHAPCWQTPWPGLGSGSGLGLGLGLGLGSGLGSGLGLGLGSNPNLAGAAVDAAGLRGTVEAAPG